MTTGARPSPATARADGAEPDQRELRRAVERRACGRTGRWKRRFRRSRSTSTSAPSRTGILNNAPIFNLSRQQVLQRRDVRRLRRAATPAVQRGEQLVPDRSGSAGTTSRPATTSRTSNRGRSSTTPTGSSTSPTTTSRRPDAGVRTGLQPPGLRFGPVGLERQDPRASSPATSSKSATGSRSRPGSAPRTQTGSSDIGQTTVDTTVLAPRLSGSYALTGDGKTLLTAQLRPLPREHHPGLLGRVRAGGAAGQLRQLHLERQRLRLLEPRRGRAGIGLHAEPRPEALSRRRVDGRVPAPVRRVDGSRRPLHLSQVGQPDRRRRLPSTRTRRSTVRFVNYDAAEREYKGVQFTLEKRFANNWNAAGQLHLLARPVAITSATTSRRSATTSTRCAGRPPTRPSASGGIDPLPRGAERRQQVRRARPTTGRTTSSWPAPTFGPWVR